MLVCVWMIAGNGGCCFYLLSRYWTLLLSSSSQWEFPSITLIPYLDHGSCRVRAALQQRESTACNRSGSTLMGAGNAPQAVKYKPWPFSTLTDPARVCVPITAVRHSLCWKSLQQLGRSTVFLGTRQYAAKDYLISTRIGSSAQLTKKFN